MKITLITPTPPDISAFGVRSISSYLRTNGHDTRLIFLPGSIGKLKDDEDYIYAYDDLVLKQIVELSADSDLVGISFFTNYFDRAIQITEHIKNNLSVPVIWGGIHASTGPEQALKYADMVCLGDGEEPLLELLNKMEKKEDYYSIQGLWFKKGNDIVKNDLKALSLELDELPYFDFSMDDHYVLDVFHGKGIIPLTIEAFKNILPRVPHKDNKLKIAFRTMTDRGCPHSCAYCNVSTQREMYKSTGSKFFRARTVKNAVAELVEVKKRFPFVEAIQFFDDTFFARPLREIEEFSKLYKKEVGLPMYCQGSPNTITEKKMGHLVDAGLVYVEMGVQTGSEKIKKLFNRNESNEKIVKTTEIVNRYLPEILPPDYHIILDVPWETEEDVMDTVKLLMDIPKPYGLCISSLVFFPQTPLYLKAKKEGLIQDEVADIYRKPFYIPPKRNYPNFLIYLLTFQHLPRRLFSLLAADSVVKFLSGRNLEIVYKMGYRIGESIRFIFKAFKVLSGRDWERIRLYFEKLRANDPVVDGRKQ